MCSSPGSKVEMSFERKFKIMRQIKTLSLKHIIIIQAKIPRLSKYERRTKKREVKYNEKSRIRVVRFLPEKYIWFYN